MFPIGGITLCPIAIFYKDYIYLQYPNFENHESIHWIQQLEMGILFFYIWYIIEWLIRLAIWPFTLFSKKWKPYKNLSFEREAYANDYNKKYLNNRKHYSWMKYIFKKI